MELTGGKKHGEEGWPAESRAVPRLKQNEDVLEGVTEYIRTSLVFGDRIQGMNRRRTDCDSK